MHHCNSIFTGSNCVLSETPKKCNALHKKHRVVRVYVFCLFLELIVPLENFSLIWRRHHYRWKAANLTYTWHSWPLSSEGSLACHIYCDKGGPFIMVISEDSWHSHLLPSVWQWSCHNLFLRGLSRPWKEPRSPAHEANTLPLRHHRGVKVYDYSK